LSGLFRAAVVADGVVCAGSLITITRLIAGTCLLIFSILSAVSRLQKAAQRISASTLKLPPLQKCSLRLPEEDQVWWPFLPNGAKVYMEAVDGSA
jgi:hypothetical protein